MIPLCVPKIKGNEWKYIKECLDTNWVSSAGSYVDRFEKDFANFLNVKKAVVMSNGTSALFLALKILDIKEDDEVIVPSLTFISSVNVIKYVGAKPVFVDVCRDTFVMNVEKVEELIGPRTKAILPVHVYGHPVDMGPLIDIAKKHNLYIVEDATESLGSLYKNKHTGTIGDMGCFSFNGNKLITTGGGGMLVTNNERSGERAKHLSTQAKENMENNAFQHNEIGYNFRLPNILAAMGCAQLENIDEYMQDKIEHANYYNELLKDVKGITLPTEKEWAKNVHWFYSIVVEDEYGISKDELIEILAENEIESRPFFMPINKMPPYIDCKHGDLSLTEELSRKGLNLPSSVGLRKEEIEKVCEVIITNQRS